MDIISEGEKILEVHKKLYEQLVEIPEKREMTYVEEIKDNTTMGKPRFKNPKYQLPKDLWVNLRDHLQNIWNFFDKYSYWFDSTIIPLLHSDERRVSKKSIIFLLEEDVWSTDEVYGDYLIEDRLGVISISYSRRDRKLLQVILQPNKESEIKEWICKDAIRQIQIQFKFLWDKLETEIQVCIEEIYHKPPKFTLEPNYLKDQLEKTIEISKLWAEAGLLNLGRIMEHWLLNKLEINNAPYYSDIIKEAEIAGLIDKNEEKLLRNIRTNYNNLKHKTYFKIDIEDIKLMVESFFKLFYS